MNRKDEAEEVIVGCHAVERGAIRRRLLTGSDNDHVLDVVDWQTSGGK